MVLVYSIGSWANALGMHRNGPSWLDFAVPADPYAANTNI